LVCMEAWHTNWTTIDRPTLFPSEASKREALHLLVRILGQAAVLFCIVDDHVHAVIMGPRRVVGPRCADLSQALNQCQNHRLNPAHFSEVKGRGHLKTLIRYVLDQTSHHDLQGIEHPALWVGSNFQDLVGARHMDGLASRLLFEHLPRLRRAEVFEKLGLPEIVPASNNELYKAGIGPLVVSAAAATGAPPNLKGNSPATVKARTAFVHLARQIGYPNMDIAHALDVNPRTVRRLVKSHIHPQIVEAVKIQVALRKRCSPWK
jgi:hypothetical protein